MELSKHYTPASIEEKWYQHWLDKRYFNSKPNDKPPFTVVIPPPNVTGVLHMGHTLNETVQDILVRRARMQGFNACWVPGSDHASIATEARVVNMLKERGIDKNQLTREKFLEYAFEWKEKYGGIIYSQIAKLGCSVDWDRVSFTMDDDYYKAVIKVFVDLYKKGLIYRGARMIHWDPAAKTALSDEEVEYKDVDGKLYYVKYVIAGEGNDSTYITIATQRPETIMGDTGICVNPNDERYKHLKGKFAIVPLVNRKVPIIFDDYVDKEFGTGALKVTPAHDINDYNLGLKHNLAVVDTLNEDGTLSAAAEVFVGMDRFDARKKVISALQEKGLLIKEENYTTRLGFSQRTNAVVEPRISTQWFVKMKEMAMPALKAVTDGDIKIYPTEKFLATYKYWLEHVKDWCISRQLWWGQRIPAWYDENGNFVVAENAEQALKEWSVVHKSTPTATLRQDEDVLDTWFSSWLWPIEVFKGITKPGNEDINYYYPTSVLVTGQDIIFFWVARMIMAGMEYKNEKPFSDVYFTGMVRDKQGRKMSKSLGNSPDLLELIDKYGADAVRFGILISSPAGNDLLFDEASLEQGRNFNNKLWNALKLVKSWELRVDHTLPKADSFAMDWFENRLNESRLEIEKLFLEYKLSEILKIVYSLIWDDFCSWYLEWIKPAMNAPIDAVSYSKTIYFFEQLLQLVHPFIPFITEEIYHLLLERKDGDDICIKQFGDIKNIAAPDQSILQKAEFLKNLVTEIRNTKTKLGLSAFTVHFSDKKYLNLSEIIQKNTRAAKVEYTNQPADGMISVVIGDEKVFIETEKQIDNHFQKNELVKEIEYQKGFLVSVNKKLENDRFIKNAKPEVIALEQKKKADAEAKIRTLEESLAALR
ncbi:MAG: valine--tRNA ligase [Bacteroidetes bacterium]|nr:valine--tRNA ligase [Bacteroidota bacterium]